MAETNQMEETKSLPPLSRKQSVSSGGKSSKPKLQTVYDFISNRTESWTLYTASQNLPSALNDPNNRETDLFTKTWGESFVPYATPPPSSLPNIELGDFMCYLKETASVSGCGWWECSRFCSHRVGSLTERLSDKWKRRNQMYLLRHHQLLQGNRYN